MIHNLCTCSHPQYLHIREPYSMFPCATCACSDFSREQPEVTMLREILVLADQAIALPDNYFDGIDEVTS